MKLVRSGACALVTGLLFVSIAHVLLLEYRSDGAGGWLQVHEEDRRDAVGSGRGLGPRVPGVGAMHYGPRTARLVNISFVYLDLLEEQGGLTRGECQLVEGRAVLYDVVGVEAGVAHYDNLLSCRAAAVVVFPPWYVARDQHFAPPLRFRRNAPRRPPVHPRAPAPLPRPLPSPRARAVLPGCLPSSIFCRPVC